MSKYINPLFEFFRADGYIPDSKILNHAIGVYPTILYVELVSRRAYFAERDGLTDDGFFFNTVESIEDATSLTDKQQRSAIGVLKEAGLIEVELRDIPAKRYFKVVDDIEILENLAQLGQEKRRKLHERYSISRSAKLDTTKRNAKNNNIVITGCH